MSNEHVVSALRAKRAEISGNIHDLEKRVATWRARLTHIDAAIRIFSPETDPEAIPPRRTYRRSGYFKSGELARLCADELRKAHGSPLTTAAIAKGILSTKKLPLDLMATISNRLQGHLRDLAKRGAIMKTGDRRTASWSHPRECDVANSR